MFKKIIIGGACLCITLLGLWSCKDSFLEFTPTDRISDAAYWKTTSDFQAGVNAAYFALQWDASGDSWQALAGMPAGDVKPTEDANKLTLESLQYASNNRYVSATWNSCYTIITRANLVLSRIELGSVGEDYAPFGGWGAQVPTKQLVAAFEKGDKRRTACILAPGEKYYGFTMDSLKTPTGYAFTKFWVGPSKNDHSPLNLPQLRFAEVLLHYAEILNESGKTADAYTQLNRVRARAGLAAKPVGDKTKCMDDIAQEWRVETFAEYNFWYELTRTGRAAAFVQKEYGRTLAPFRTLFPIPQSELDLNKALKQNPGY